MSTNSAFERPNVILITTDQQRKDALGCYGSGFVNTPHLDRLAAAGVRFDRAYCTSPVCTPSRASIYSGKAVSKHGAWNVGMTVSEEDRYLQHHLKATGYRTHHIGKLHFQPYLTPAAQSMESTAEWERHYPAFDGPYYGFDRVEMCMGHTTNGVAGHYGAWVKERSGTTKFPHRSLASSSFGGEAVQWDIPPHLTNTEWVRERTVAFLNEQAAAERPFFLSVGFQDPHHPHALPEALAHDLKPDRIPLPQRVSGELDDKPPFFNDVYYGRWSEEHPFHGQYPLAGQGFSSYKYHEVSDEDARLARAYYYRMVERIDEAVGDILRALEQRGFSENTIVVFTSDHGELLGDHGIWMKGPFHYEALINVPLLVRWPASFRPESRTDLISLADLAPALLSACGAEIPQSMDGLDWSAALLNGEIWPRDLAFVEHVDDPMKLRLKTIVTKQYKLTVYIGQPFGELYDLAQDPAERRNLWNDPKAAPIKDSLFAMLLREMEKREKRIVRTSYA